MAYHRVDCFIVWVSFHAWFYLRLYPYPSVCVSVSVIVTVAGIWQILVLGVVIINHLLCIGRQIQTRIGQLHHSSTELHSIVDFTFKTFSHFDYITNSAIFLFSSVVALYGKRLVVGRSQWLCLFVSADCLALFALGLLRRNRREVEKCQGECDRTEWFTNIFLCINCGNHLSSSIT